MSELNFLIIRSRAEHSRELRKSILNVLYQASPLGGDGSNVTQTNQILNDLSQSFSRYAGNQQTAFDNGAPASSAGGTASLMQRQVERAISQVLGRAPGRGAESFIGALNGAFPAVNGGQVSFTPSRSMVSLYTADSSPAIGNGFAGQLPARQANLYRQAAIITGDALKVLEGLQPFDPRAELDQVEALRKLIRATLNSIVDEFSRVEEPRQERVRLYLQTLELHLNQFGGLSFLNRVSVPPATESDESMTTGFELLKNYNGNLHDIWNKFSQKDTSSQSFSLSERVDRANILLPVISQANNEFESALNSVGLLESERHSMALKFTVLEKFQTQTLVIPQPDLTVFDLTDWLDRFSNLEGPVALADSGQYGLDFVTDQANTLTFEIIPIVAYLRSYGPGIGKGGARLPQILSNERVVQSLDNLLAQLDSLADLAAPGGDQLTKI